MQKLFIASTMSVAVLAGCSLFTTQSQPDVEFQAEQAWQAVPDPLIQSGTLANGLDWYVKSLPDNGVRDRIELRLRIRSGSLEETDEELGLAHFVEHMAFNGTERFPKQDIVEFFEAAGMTFGGDINAHTSFDETVYKLTIPADQPELVNTAFDVMYDWATAISFSQDEVTKEAPVVIEEWRARFGTEEQSWLQEYKDLYQGTRLLNRLPVGDKDIVANATAEQLAGYYQKWYRPDNAEFVVVYPEGTFDAPEKISTVFSAWVAEPTPQEDFTTGAVAIEGKRFKAVTDSDVTSYQWQLYLPVKDYGSESPLAREVDFIDGIYANVLDARLQRLGEIEGAAIIDAGVQTNSFYDKTKHLDVWASVYEGKQDQALRDITLELNRLTAYGLTAAEYDNAKNKLLARGQNIQSWLQGAESGDHAEFLLYLLGEGVTLEDVDASILETKKMTEVVTLEKVNRYIAQTISPKNLAAYFYHPKTTTPETQAWEVIYSDAWAQRVTAPVEKEVLSSGDDYQFTGDVVQEVDLTEDEGLYIWVLENGVPVILKQTDFEPGRVSLQTLVFGGNRQLGDELIAASEQWRQARVRSGLGGLSGQDFVDSLQLDGIGYDVFLNDGYSGVDISGQADQLQRMFKLTAGTFTDESFNDQLVALTINSSAEQAAQFEATPYYQFITQYLPAVYGNDPRYTVFSQSQIEAISQAQLLAVQQSILNESLGVVMVLVGDVTPEQVTPWLKQHIAGLPFTQAEGYNSIGPVTEQSQFIKVAGQAEEKTDIRYVFAQTELPVDPALYMVSEVMIQALDKRLHNAIREDSGLTYGTSVFQRPQYFYEQQWLLHVRLSTDPVREEEALAALDSTLQRVLDEPFSDTEVSEANHRVLEQYKQAHTTNSGLLNELISVVTIGGDITDYNDYEVALSTVTQEQVNALVAQLLNGKKVVVIHHP